MALCVSLAFLFRLRRVDRPRDHNAPVDLVESKAKQFAKLADAAGWECWLVDWTLWLHGKQFKAVEDAD